jgi:hypothetical protein
MGQWLTPDDQPTGERTIALTIPTGEGWEAILRGALAPLFDPASFEQFGTLTPEETAAAFQATMIDSWSALEDCP